MRNINLMCSDNNIKKYKPVKIMPFTYNNHSDRLGCSAHSNRVHPKYEFSGIKQPFIVVIPLANKLNVEFSYLY